MDLVEPVRNAIYEEAGEHKREVMIDHGPRHFGASTVVGPFLQCNLPAFKPLLRALQWSKDLDSGLLEQQLGSIYHYYLHPDDCPNGIIWYASRRRSVYICSLTGAEKRCSD